MSRQGHFAAPASGGGSGDSHSDARTALRERDAQLGALDEAFKAAATGSGSLLTVVGEPGAGKSALLAAARSGASRAGLSVLAATGRRLERALAYGVVLQLFEATVAEHAQRSDIWAGPAAVAARLLAPDAPFVDSESQPPDVHSTLRGLHGLTANLARLGPLFVCVDDAHEADVESLRFLLYLGQRVHRLPVCLALAMPPHPAEAHLGELLRLEAVRSLALERLGPASVADAARARLPEAPDELCDAVFEASQGNPLLMAALIDHLVAAGVEGPASARGGRLRAAGIPAVADWVIHRTRLAGPEAEKVARAVAVLGGRAPLRHAAAVADLQPSQTAEVATTLTELGVLRPGRDLQYAYQLAARSVYLAMPPAQRSSMHFAASRILTEEGAPVEEVARHLVETPGTAREPIVDVLVDAGAAATARGAPRQAVRYLRRALAEPPAQARRPLLVLELGRAESLAGDRHAVEHLYESMPQLEAAQERAEVALDVGRLLIAQARFEEAVEACDRGLREVGSDERLLSSRLRSARALAARLAPPPRAHSVAPLPKELVEGAGADTPEGRVLLGHVALERALAGEPAAQVAELARKALGGGALLEQETADGHSHYLAAAALTLCEALTAAEVALTTALHDARERGSELGMAAASSFRSWAVLRRGRLQDAEADARQALAVARTGWPILLPGAHAVQVEVLLERGAVDAALNHLETAVQEAGQGLVALAQRGAKARALLAAGRPDEALSAYLDCGRRATAAGVLNPAAFAWRSGAAMAAAQLHRHAQARELVEEELALASSFGTPGPIGRALGVLGVIEGDRAGLAALEQAVTVLEGSQAVLLRARALVEHGAALRRFGRRDAARAQLRRGLDLAERCGARALATRAKDEIRAAGGRPRRAALSGAAALTARERQVAMLVAGGMSNREVAERLFITIKTVEWHLSSTYRKLGISSRDQLAGALGEPRG